MHAPDERQFTERKIPHVMQTAGQIELFGIQTHHF